MKDSKPQVVMTDADGMDALAPASGLVVIAITKREVDEGRVGDVIDRLMKLTDSKESVLRFQDSVAIMFSGYDQDPRHLSQIPEVVSYFRRVHAMWPYWYHFLVKMPDMFLVLLTLLVDTEVVQQRRGEVGLGFKRPGDLDRLIKDLFTPMNSLYEANGIGMQENRAMTSNVAATLKACLG